MLGYLKDMFLSILTLLIFATITSNILEYIRVLLKLSLLLRIYRQPLDQPNLAYIVSPIRKPEYKCNIMKSYNQSCDRSNLIGTISDHY